MQQADFQITAFSHRLASPFLHEGALCIDATMGKGQDTVFLCQGAGNAGRVIAFDIQPEALEHTGKALENEGLTNAELILQSHENMADYASPETVDLIMFNLGYLPGGDHSICTRAPSTITALNQALTILKKGGAICLVIYSGGDTGNEEKEAVLQWLKNLNPRQYLVILSEYYNRPNNPPVPVMIIKL